MYFQILKEKNFLVMFIPFKLYRNLGNLFFKKLNKAKITKHKIQFCVINKIVFQNIFQQFA